MMPWAIVNANSTLPLGVAYDNRADVERAPGRAVTAQPFLRWLGELVKIKALSLLGAEDGKPAAYAASIGLLAATHGGVYPHGEAPSLFLRVLNEIRMSSNKAFQVSELVFGCLQSGPFFDSHPAQVPWCRTFCPAADAVDAVAIAMQYTAMDQQEKG